MIWLLSIEVAGRTWRLASVSCAPLRAGVEVPHHGSLSVDGFGEGLEIGGGVSGPCSASVAFHLGADGWEFFRDGHRLDGARAEVALWREGWTYAQRVVLLRGIVDAGGAIPLDGQDIEATISAPLIRSVTAWPPADDVLTVAAWPSLPATDGGWDLTGEPYPWPIGQLGAFVDDDGDDKTATTTRVLIVDPSSGVEVGVVAGAPVAATNVRIWNSVHKDRADFAVTVMDDGDGNPRAVVSFATAPAAWTFDGTEDYYVVDWLDGGLIGETSSQKTNGLGDAIVFLLARRYGVDGPDLIDYGSWAAWAAVLNGWSVGIDVASGDPLDVITGDLMTLCPALWIVGGPAGYRPIYLDEMAPTRTLAVGRDIFATDEQPTFASLDPVNAVSTSFAPSTNAGTFRAVVEVTSAQTYTGAAGESRHGAAAESEDAQATFDRGTAALRGTEAIRIRWTPPMVLTYEAPADVALTLALGGRYSVVDPDRNLDGRAVWLLARETEDGETWTISLYGLW